MRPVTAAGNLRQLYTSVTGRCELPWPCYGANRGFATNSQGSSPALWRLSTKSEIALITWPLSASNQKKDHRRINQGRSSREMMGKNLLSDSTVSHSELRRQRYMMQVAQLSTLYRPIKVSRAAGIMFQARADKAIDTAILSRKDKTRTITRRR